MRLGSSANASEAEIGSARTEEWDAPLLTPRWLALVERWVVIVLFGLLTVLGTLQILNRHVLKLPLWNIEQLMPQLQMAMVFLGLSMSYRHRAHLAVELVPHSLPPRVRRWYLTGVWLLNAGFIATLAVIGVLLMQFQFDISAVTNMGYPASALTGCLVLGCVLSLLRIWQLELRPLLAGAEAALW